MRIKGMRLGRKRRLRDVFLLKRKHRHWQRQLSTDEEDPTTDKDFLLGSKREIPETENDNKSDTHCGNSLVETYDESRSDVFSAFSEREYFDAEEMRNYNRLEFMADSPPIRRETK
jgi:hypothetical protein